ncbi:MAG TPA: response regulator transcription factor [Solirubrobacteraceae bacterium]|nr:response regulator transcription factor [Solirubrobacteraceae bacterium]
MTRPPGVDNHDRRVLELQQPRVRQARRTRHESNGSSGRWSHELSAIEGGAFDHCGAAQTCAAVRVLLAEGVGLVRAGLRSLLEREGDISVAAEASTGEQAVALVIETRPDVLVMHIRLPGLDGLAATRRILSDPDLSGTRVVIVTDDEREEDLLGALRSGASGFVMLDAEPMELVRAVRVVAAGGAQLSPWATRRILDEFASAPDPPPAYPEHFDELTSRERHIVSLVALGLTNGEIAERLVISPATVKTHVSRAMLKLHARDRAKLVALAYQTGFVQRRRTGDARSASDHASPPLAVVQRV